MMALTILKSEKGTTLVEALVASILVGIIFGAAMAGLKLAGGQILLLANSSAQDRLVASIQSTLQANMEASQHSFNTPGHLITVIDVNGDPQTVLERNYMLSTLPIAWSESEFAPSGTCAQQCPGRMGYWVQLLDGDFAGLKQVSVRATHPALWAGARTFTFLAY